jgi:hypothetical protein
MRRRDKGYRHIDWKGLPRRIDRHIPWLRECLKKKAVPVFRKEYIKTKHLSVIKLFGVSSWHSGYYGPEGQELM